MQQGIAYTEISPSILFCSWVIHIFKIVRIGFLRAGNNHIAASNKVRIIQQFISESPEDFAFMANGQSCMKLDRPVIGEFEGLANVYVLDEFGAVPGYKEVV